MDIKARLADLKLQGVGRGHEQPVHLADGLAMHFRRIHKRSCNDRTGLSMISFDCRPPAITCQASRS